MAIGREGSFIVLPSGKRVFSTALAYGVTPQVRSFRATQVSPGAIEAEVVLQDGVNAEAASRSLREAWEKILEGQLEVRVRIVVSITPEPSGKLRYFVPLESAQTSA